MIIVWFSPNAQFDYNTPQKAFYILWKVYIKKVSDAMEMPPCHS